MLRHTICHSEKFNFCSTWAYQWAFVRVRESPYYLSVSLYYYCSVSQLRFNFNNVVRWPSSTRFPWVLCNLQHARWTLIAQASLYLISLVTLKINLRAFLLYWYHLREYFAFYEEYSYIFLGNKDRLYIFKETNYNRLVRFTFF